MLDCGRQMKSIHRLHRLELNLCNLWMGGEWLANDAEGFLQLGTNQLQSRRTNASVSHPDFLLDQLDQLHKFRNCIHPQKREKPVVEPDRLFAFAVHCIVEEI